MPKTTRTFLPFRSKKRGKVKTLEGLYCNSRSKYHSLTTREHGTWHFMTNIIARRKVLNVIQSVYNLHSSCPACSSYAGRLTSKLALSVVQVLLKIVPYWANRILNGLKLHAWSTFYETYLLTTLNTVLHIEKSVSAGIAYLNSDFWSTRGSSSVRVLRKSCIKTNLTAFWNCNKFRSHVRCNWTAKCDLHNTGKWSSITTALLYWA